ncbi:GntR family transcriptional regulator [Bradyrhizobium sp. NAS80.1]|uniref:GntR family transcriptional regulator n=1 Tax=Bradyrhizobium sp. NAS80.1 TaxID=1680159 RepID=UPI000A04A602
MDEAPVTSASDVTELLRERILSGDVPSGSRLQQIPLSESLGVSRTPLREALAQLAKEGLLIYEPNRGYAVRAFSTAEISAAFEVRARLEALACGIVARQGASREVLDRLRECVAEGDRILAKGVLASEDLIPYRRMNVDFHETIIQTCENRFVSSFVRQCHNVPMASDRVFIWEDYQVIARSHDDHHRILDAIAKREAQRAESLMSEHIYFALLVLRRKLDEDGRAAQLQDSAD